MWPAVHASAYLIIDHSFLDGIFGDPGDPAVRLLHKSKLAPVVKTGGGGLGMITACFFKSSMTVLQ